MLLRYLVGPASAAERQTVACAANRSPVGALPGGQNSKLRGISETATTRGCPGRERELHRACPRFASDQTSFTQGRDVVSRLMRGAHDGLLAAPMGSLALVSAVPPRA